MNEGETVLLATVKHTFTNSVFYMLKQEYKLAVRHHTWPYGATEAKSGKYLVVTTYRDPRDVAFSWIKRKPIWRTKIWRDQWEAWGQIIPLVSKIYRLEDLTCHLGVRDDFREDHSHVDHSDMESDIQYAEDICREVLK
jgi:hypothetical protein